MHFASFIESWNDLYINIYMLFLYLYFWFWIFYCSISTFIYQFDSHDGTCIASVVGQCIDAPHSGPPAVQWIPLLRGEIYQLDKTLSFFVDATVCLIKNAKPLWLIQQVDPPPKLIQQVETFFFPERKTQSWELQLAMKTAHIRIWLMHDTHTIYCDHFYIACHLTHIYPSCSRMVFCLICGEILEYLVQLGVHPAIFFTEGCPEIWKRYLLEIWNLRLPLLQPNC